MSMAYVKTKETSYKNKNQYLIAKPGLNFYQNGPQQKLVKGLNVKNVT